MKADDSALVGGSIPRSSAINLRLSAAVLLLQRTMYGGMNQVSDIATQTGHFPHDTRTEEREMSGRHQEHGLQVRVELAVHQGHLEFVLKVANRPQAAHHEIGVDFLGEVREQPPEGADIHPLLVAPDPPRYDAKINEIAREVARLYPDFEGLGHLVAFVFRKKS